MAPNGSNGPTWLIPGIVGGISAGVKGAISRFSDSGGSAPFIGLLDLYPMAVVGYSLRQLTAAANRAIAVRNDSNITIDIGFLPDGELDQAAILAHCGAGNGHVPIVYNQPTNGASGNFTQPTAASQYRICTAGVVHINPSSNKPILATPDNVRYGFVGVLDAFRNTPHNQVYMMFQMNVGTGSGTRNRAIFYADKNVTSTFTTTPRLGVFTGNNLSDQHNLFVRSGATDGALNSSPLLATGTEWASGGTPTYLRLVMNWEQTVSGGGPYHDYRVACVSVDTDAPSAPNINTSDTNSAYITFPAYFNGLSAGNIQPAQFQELIIYKGTANEVYHGQIDFAIGQYYSKAPT